MDHSLVMRQNQTFKLWLHDNTLIKARKKMTSGSRKGLKQRKQENDTRRKG